MALMTWPVVGAEQGMAALFSSSSLAWSYSYTTHCYITHSPEHLGWVIVFYLFLDGFRLDGHRAMVYGVIHCHNCHLLLLWPRFGLLGIWLASFDVLE